MSREEAIDAPSPTLIRLATEGFLREMPLVEAVDEFLHDTLIAETGVAELYEGTEPDLPVLAVAANQGKLLNLLARSMDARSILEIGTLVGYSTIWLARALSDGEGRVITLEADPEYAEIAGRNLGRAGLADRVHIRVGPALGALSTLRDELKMPFDLVFIDADKENDVAYVEWALELCRPGALIVIDNVVRFGGVINHEAAEYDAGARGSHEVLKFIGEHPRLDGTALQTVGVKGWDGLAFALVTP